MYSFVIRDQSPVNAILCYINESPTDSSRPILTKFRQIPPNAAKECALSRVQNAKQYTSMIGTEKFDLPSAQKTSKG